MSKVLEAEVWCPSCKHYEGKIFRKEVREGFFTHVTVPKKIPTYCSVCEGVLIRK